MPATTVLKGLLGPGKLHARIDDIKRAKGAPPWSEKLVVNHFHHIRPKGTGPTIRLAITPAGEFHRHDR
jgi:hypothetical protein